MKSSLLSKVIISVIAFCGSNSWAGEVHRALPAGPSNNASGSSAACATKPLEAQFIGTLTSVPKTENPKRTDPTKGVLCRFRMGTLTQFSPATGSCPFYDQGRLTENDIEVWLPKKDGCPEKGDSFSGVAQVTPDGRLEFDASVTKNDKCRGKPREAQFIAEVASGSQISDAKKTSATELTCRFKIKQLEQFSPAVGSCAFTDESRLLKDEFEMSASVDEGCPAKGDSYSGVVQLMPNGKLKFDAELSKGSK